jgi:hypothetical protein
VLVPSRHAEDLFAGWWQLIAGLGGVPRSLVWDGEGAIGRWRAGKPELTAECQAFRGTLGTRVVVCRPADPEAKGLVERVNGYLETSFLPGRRFASPADFNIQLAEWTATVNGRVRRALGCSPADRIAADRQAVLGLPPVAPEVAELEWRSASGNVVDRERGAYFPVVTFRAADGREVRARARSGGVPPPARVGERVRVISLDARPALPRPDVGLGHRRHRKHRRAPPGGCTVNGTSSCG